MKFLSQDKQTEISFLFSEKGDKLDNASMVFLQSYYCDGWN